MVIASKGPSWIRLWVTIVPPPYNWIAGHIRARRLKFKILQLLITCPDAMDRDPPSKLIADPPQFVMMELTIPQAEHPENHRGCPLQPFTTQSLTVTELDTSA